VTRLRSVLLSMPLGLGYRLARGLGVLDPGTVAPGAVVVAPTLSRRARLLALPDDPTAPVPFAPPDAEVLSAVADLPDKGFSRRPPTPSRRARPLGLPDDPTAPVPFAPPDAEVLSAVADLPDKGFSRRLRVRAPGDVWSDEFRQELRRDRAFEASLVWRQATVLLVIAVVFAVRIVSS
jgi:hypothetical protein